MGMIQFCCGIRGGAWSLRPVICVQMRDNTTLMFIQQAECSREKHREKDKVTRIESKITEGKRENEIYVYK